MPRPAPPSQRLSRTGRWARRVALVLSLVAGWAVDRGNAEPLATVDPEAGLPFLRAFSAREYRGHQQVLCGVEDAEGRCYFGNLNRLLVFDGVRWSHLPVPEATFIRGLAIDAQDVLWLGGVDQLGFARLDATGLRTFVSLRDRLPPEAREPGDLASVVVRGVEVYFASAQWLLRWDGTRFASLRLPAGGPWRLTAAGPEVWASQPTLGPQRVRFDAGQLRLEPLPSSPECPPALVVGVVAAAEPGTFLVATERSGLRRWDGRQFTPFPTAADPGLRAAPLSDLATLSGGRLAVSSRTAGVWLLDARGDVQAHLTEPTGLLDPTVHLLLASRRTESLWIGLGRGLVRVDTRPWLSWFHPANGAPRTKLFAATRLDNGTLILPAAAGGLLRLQPARAGEPSRLVRDPAATGLVNAVTPFGSSLLLTGSGGIVELDASGRQTPLPEAPVGATGFFPLRQRPGVWAALNNDRVHLYTRETDGWRPRGIVPELTRVRGIAEDSDGSWWLGRPSGGVLHARFGADPTAPPVVETLTAPAALPPGHGWTRFTTDAHGPLLTCNLGLLRYAPAERRFLPVTDYGAELADGSTHVNGAIADHRGGLWMLLRKAGEAEAGNEVRLAYGRGGKLTTLRLPALAEIDDPTHFHHEPAGAGRPEALWVSGHGALVRLDLDRWRAAPPEPTPRLLIRTLTSGAGRLLPLAGGWELPVGDHSLAVRFAVPEWSGETATLFETTLIGPTGSDVQSEPLPARDFAALASGNYVLRARARSAGGIWTEPVSLSFRVLPPWWWSGPALAAYALAVAAALAAAYRSRLRRWQSRQRELEAAVAQRTAQLTAQNTELVQLRQIEIDEKLAARLAEHRSRLEVLRYQLNPHFLFNTLNAVCSQIIAAPRVARDTVIRLAEFCRLTLHRPTPEADPTLGEEIEMLRAYLDIEQTRLGELLRYEITCDPALHPLPLPPFLLLPLVENAVKYGAATSRDEVRIRLSFTRGADGQVLIEVANTGNWRTPTTLPTDVPSLGIGLENLRQRLTRYFPGRHTFSTEPADGWVIVRVELQEP